MPKKQTKYQKLVELGKEAVRNMETARAEESQAIKAWTPGMAQKHHDDWMLNLGKRSAYTAVALLVFGVYSDEFLKQIGYKEV